MKTGHWGELKTRPHSAAASLVLLGEVALRLEHLGLLCTLPNEPCPGLEICCVDVELMLL